MALLSKYKFWRYPLFLKIKYRIIALFEPDAINITYWLNSSVLLWSIKINPFNWGDYANMILASMISKKNVIPYKYCKQKNSISMMGSILPWSMTSTTIVWGSGCLDSTDTQWYSAVKPQKICSVRGPLTREILLKHGFDCPEIYGDPALLFPRFYVPKMSKKYRFGIIFHASTSSQSKDWFDNHNIDNSIYIDVQKFGSWRDFIDKICSCEVILSSSLHGIIIADAYLIPNVWVTLNQNEHPDNNFKFHDYFMSVKRDINEPLMIDDVDFMNMEYYIKQYVRPTIDLDMLLNSCPFYESKNQL